MWQQYGENWLPVTGDKIEYYRRPSRKQVRARRQNPYKCRRPLLTAVVTGHRGCHVGVDIPAQRPSKTSPKVAQLALSSGYFVVGAELTESRNSARRMTMYETPQQPAH